MRYKLSNYLLLAMILISLGSCKKEKSPEPVEEEIVEPSPVGTSTGPKVSKEIGSAGGSVSTASGDIAITIPSGALSENKTISIEPISSTNPAGVGQSFRLLPHGTKFLKPVEVTFSYARVKNTIPLLDALTVSYQDDKGIWRISGETQINRTAETITVKTDHFSDWVPMKWLDLVPGNADLETGKQLTLKALRYIEVEDEDFLVVPLVPGKVKDAPVIKAVPLENKHIIKWELGGAGDLQSKGNTAVLTAPKSITSGSGAAVSLEVKSPGTMKRLLVANINYISEEYLLVRFNGGEWKPYFGQLSNIMGKTYSISGMVNREDQWVPLAITWKDGEGIHKWTDTHERDHFVDFQYAYSGYDYISQYYETYEEAFAVSGGSLNIPKINKDGYTTGTFELISAGRWNEKGFAGTLKVEGKFKLKFFQF